MSALDNVLARLHGVTRKGNLTLARCPAHADSKPSMSIRETPDGRVLTNCFAGCSFAEIVAALQMRASDFFPPRDKQAEEYAALRRSALRRRFRSASANGKQAILDEQMDAALERVRARYVGEGGFHETSPLRAAHHNEARAEVADLLGIDLAPLPAFAWEGGPHDTDPAWPTLYATALEQAIYERWTRWQTRAIERFGEVYRPLFMVGVTDPEGPTLGDRIRAELLAASWLRGMTA